MAMSYSVTWCRVASDRRQHDVIDRARRRSARPRSARAQRGPKRYRACRHRRPRPPTWHAHRRGRPATTDQPCSGVVGGRSPVPMPCSAARRSAVMTVIRAPPVSSPSRERTDRSTAAAAAEPASPATGADRLRGYGTSAGSPPLPRRCRPARAQPACRQRSPRPVPRGSSTSPRTDDHAGPVAPSGS